MNIFYSLVQNERIHSLDKHNPIEIAKFYIQSLPCIGPWKHVILKDPLQCSPLGIRPGDSESLMIMSVQEYVHFEVVFHLKHRYVPTE